MNASHTIPAGWALIEADDDFATVALPVPTTVLRPVNADTALDAWAEQEKADLADPVVVYMFPGKTIADEERYCPDCALREGVILDERSVAVRASEYTHDEDEHNNYYAGRECCMCGTRFPGAPEFHLSVAPHCFECYL